MLSAMLSASLRLARAWEAATAVAAALHMDVAAVVLFAVVLAVAVLAAVVLAAVVLAAAAVAEAPVLAMMTMVAETETLPRLAEAARARSAR